MRSGTSSQWRSACSSAARFTCHDYRRTTSVTALLQKLQWDPLQQCRVCSWVLMLYRIRNGLVAIPASIYLQPTVVHTRGLETSYRQIQCNTSMYNQTFFPSAIRLWNTLPADVCQLPPDSLRLNWTPSSWCNCRLTMFLIAPLHCFYQLLFSFLLSTTTVLNTSMAHTCIYTAMWYLCCILLDLWTGVYRKHDMQTHPKPFSWTRNLLITSHELEENYAPPLVTR